jgi:hypothetical protein
MDRAKLKTYRKEKGYESVEIETYAVKEGFSFGVSVMVKWQGFLVACPGHCGGEVINGAYIFRTEKEALRGAVKYIREITGNDHNYTPAHKAVIEKLLPDTSGELFEEEE